MSPRTTFSALRWKKPFQVLGTIYSFDDKNTRHEKRRGDKYAAMREFFESVNVQNARTRDPSTFVSVDETLYPYRMKTGIKQCSPSKVWIAI